MFSGDSAYFRSFEKEVIISAEYAGFGQVLKDTREIPVADPSHLIQSTEVTKFYR